MKLNHRDPYPFEWYQTYGSLKHLIHFDKHEQPENRETEDVEQISFPPKRDCRVLILGCGTSRLGEDMIKDGWTSEIVNVDFSSTVIGTVKERYFESYYKKNSKSMYAQRQKQSIENSQKFQPEEQTLNTSNLHKMSFKCADVTEGLPYQDGSFDLIFCKGTLDSILCANGATLKCRKMMDECHRLLNRRHGVFFVVSFGAPENRLLYFENEEKPWWDAVEVHKVPKRRQCNASVQSVNVSK